MSARRGLRVSGRISPSLDIGIFPYNPPLLIISILSEWAAKEAAQEGKILVFAPESPLLERQFYLLYRRSSPLSPAAAMLVEELRYFYRDGA